MRLEDKITSIPVLDLIRSMTAKNSESNETFTRVVKLNENKETEKNKILLKKALEEKDYSSASSYASKIEGNLDEIYCKIGDGHLQIVEEAVNSNSVETPNPRSNITIYY